ncbi:DJ-1 family glyoxalase III [Halorhodospira sp. 9622]|uniref:DJ-1 family glyoxalase III n=1 Tax=Halorhodospira sp. 9622 TaxID=2899136 RepID=UPI001EE93D38|nr:DJ-1 family glyoxalase III [Halorhodospira sp. 9622]MCG5538804.1 DJ-1/PfpI family protein [Halorhodospira sp. 9622]
MSVRVLVPLAEGCEELEAVTVIDLLRRVGAEVVVAGLESGTVRASRGVQLVPDTDLDRVAEESFDLIVLPGGLGGAERLESDARIVRMLQAQNESDGWIAAICAAPRVLAEAGVLQGRRATAFPTQLERHGIEPEDSAVVIDDNLITSRGPGTAMDFALRLIEVVYGDEKAAEVEGTLQRPLSHQRY